ncbi:MAG: class I SAM-dependent methyltransferase, partial [Rubrobacteridae bacterium]|nr:class I SAM-dependent methyltransferase [Rubrobacteridae bacterium]
KWKTKELSELFIDNVRGGIPSAGTQIEVMLKIIDVWNPNVKTVIDLGCGDGILGKSVLLKFPSIELICVDFSDAMLENAKKNFNNSESVRFINADFSTPGWKEVFNKRQGFDLIVSGFSIHHQSNDRKREIYEEIYGLLNPNGIFLNLEHVLSATKDIGAVFDDYFIDHLHSFHREADPAIERKTVAEKHYNRPDKEENILAPLELQCRWLRDIGYQDVDCFFKVFELALFGGRKPE